MIMKIRITESQFKGLIKENIDDILDRINDIGFENLKPSEKRKLSHFQKHLEKGGTEEDFVYDEEPEVDEMSGKKFQTTINGKPLVFVFTEKIKDSNNDLELIGEIFYDGNEYLGTIVTNDTGILLDYDFYDSLNLGGSRIQSVLKNDIHELEYFFETVIIPELT
jgi:hypothetical protein